MSSYSASLITLSTTGKPMASPGSFANILIDGRLSLQHAIEVARDALRKEAELKNSEYMGFAIEKTPRIGDYKSPKIVDNDVHPQDILFLLD